MNKGQTKPSADSPKCSETLPDVDRVIELNSRCDGSCTECRDCATGFDGVINHYIKKHGYVLLNVRTVTELGYNSETDHVAIALLGHPRK